MADLPTAVYYWRPVGAADDEWTLNVDGEFQPGSGVEVEVVTVGPSQSATITANVLIFITGVPTIAGSPLVGSTLTATAAPVTGVEPITRTWQWKRSGVDIAGAISDTYTLVADDAGNTITVVQGASNGQGSATAESAATNTISAPAVWVETPPAIDVEYETVVTQPLSSFASGDAPLTYSLDGPAWLSIDPATGVVSGTAPSTDVDATATVTVSNAINPAGADTSISVIVGPPAHELASINADGWSATHLSTPPTYTPDTAPIVATPDRDGFDATGSATTISEDIVLTTRVRQAYPNQASPTTDQVALSDYIYSTDTISGVTNNSTVTSPKPVANWADFDRRIVGDTLDSEVVAFHRDARGGKQVAAVRFYATDGTTTVDQVVSTPTVSAKVWDRQALPVYACSLDVSSLDDDAEITLNAEVFPHFGNAASVLDSADQTARREFSPRSYYRSTANTPPVAYVDTSTGNDTTGAVSRTDATAAASPFATISGAIGAAGGLRAFGDANGAIIYLREGTHTLLSSGTTPLAMDSAALTTKPEAGATKAATIVQFGTSQFRPRIQAGGGSIRVEGCTVDRTGAENLAGEATSFLEMEFVDCDFDNGSVSSAMQGGNCSISLWGVAFTNLGSSVLAPGAQPIDIVRGCSGALAGTLEGWRAFSNDFSGGNGIAFTPRPESGSIVTCNRFMSQNKRVWEVGASGDVTGAVFAQNVVEFVGVASEAAIWVSADNSTSNTSHIILHHNTIIGFDLYGRSNLFYDDAASASLQGLMSVKANIMAQINTKSDVFEQDGTKTGNWPFEYGVGCQGNFSLYQDAQGGGIGSSFAQDYPGLGADISDSRTVMNGGPAGDIFTDFRATTSGPTAGAGGGDYTLVTGAAPKGIADAVIRFDASGTERAATTSAGAYE